MTYALPVSGDHLQPSIVSREGFVAIADSAPLPVDDLAAGDEQLALHAAAKPPRKFENNAFGRPSMGVGGPGFQPRAAYAVCRVVGIATEGNHDIAAGQVAENETCGGECSPASAPTTFFSA